MKPKHRHACTLGFILLLAASCAGIKPKFTPTSYYTLSVEPVKGVSTQHASESIRVERLSARPRYDDRIVTQRSPYELEYGEFHRWVEKPDSLVTGTVADWLRESEVFGTVFGPESRQETDCILRGSVLVFERRNDRAICTLELSLVDRTGHITWSKTLTTSVPLRDDSYAALAEGLSHAMQKLLQEAVEQW